MHGQGVAGQQHIDETGADELAEIRHAAGVHEDRTGHDGDPPTTPLDVADHLGNPRDARLDAALRRNFVRHERKAEPVALAEFRRHSDAFYSTDDHIAGADVAELAALRAIAFDHDGRIHSLTIDLEPLAAVTDECPLVGRGVEVVGHASILVCGLNRGVVAAGDSASQRHERLEDALQLRAHPDR